MKNNRNIKTFKSFNESNDPTSFYRGDFAQAKAFYNDVIVPACGDCNPLNIVDTLVNDDASDDTDLVQYFCDEYGLTYETAEEIVRGRNFFLDQLFDPDDLEDTSLEEKEIIRDRTEKRVPNEGKGKVSDNVKSKLKDLRSMSDNELLKFLNAGMTPAALKRFMK